MKLEDIVLTTVSVAQYYNEFVVPLDPNRFRAFNNGSTSICPLHDDTDPSFGIINDRHKKGVKIFHCFGCGRTGSVIDLHRSIQIIYHNNDLSIKEATLDLCRIYNIDATLYEDTETEGATGYYTNMSRKVARNMDRYTIQEYKDDLLKVRKAEGVALEIKAKAVNSANIKYMVTTKGLLD